MSLGVAPWESAFPRLPPGAGPHRRNGPERVTEARPDNLTCQGFYLLSDRTIVLSVYRIDGFGG